jgi:hypothetical protein
MNARMSSANRKDIFGRYGCQLFTEKFIVFPLREYTEHYYIELELHLSYLTTPHPQTLQFLQAKGTKISR